MHNFFLLAIKEDISIMVQQSTHDDIRINMLIGFSFGTSVHGVVTLFFFLV